MKGKPGPGAGALPTVRGGEGGTVARAGGVVPSNIMRTNALAPRGSSRVSWVRLLPILPALLWSGPLHGQDGVRISVVPRAGMAAPDAYFYEYFKNFYGDGPMEWTTGSLGRSFAAGVGVEVSLGAGLRVRGEVLRTFDGWLSSVHSLERPRVLFDPPEIVNTWLDVPAAVTVASVQLVLPTAFQVAGIQPFVLVGVGGKHYDFGEPTLPNEVEATLPSDGFTWGGEVGAGVTFPVWGPLRGEVQLRDALSRYWGKTQHDLLYTGALLIPLR